MRIRPVLLCFFAVLAAPALAQQKVMIADPPSNCATSNPFPKGNERITWTGGCQNGLLSGQGVLTWYRDDRMTERNEGSFRNGELNGEATTTFPDGSSVVGAYSDGRRNGEFVVIRGDGTYIRAVYQNDKLVSERELSRRQVRALIDERRSQPPQPRRETPEPAQAAAPAYQPQPAYAAPVYTPAAAPAPTPVVTAPLAAAAAVPVAAVPVAAAAIPSAPPAATSSYVPPWSPTANAAAISGRGAYAAAPAAAYQQPAYQQPAYQPSVYAAPVATPPAASYQQAYAPAPAPAPMVAAPAAAPPPPMQPAAVAAPTGMVARRVCTAPGLYPNNAGWCGIVRAEQPGEIQVEVTDVRVNSIFAIGISPGECTGSEFIGSGSKGSKVWVPSRCMR